MGTGEWGQENGDRRMGTGEWGQENEERRMGTGEWGEEDVGDRIRAVPTCSWRCRSEYVTN